MKFTLLFTVLCLTCAKYDASPLILNGLPKHELNPEALNREFTDYGELLTEGDMILTYDQWNAFYGPFQTRKAIDDVTKRWTDGVVPYAISKSSEKDREVILSGLQHWMDNSCLYFTEVDEDAAKPHLIFKKLTGCHSAVGMQKKNGQDVSIGEGCDSMGTVAHEVGHALGFYHEQSRPDRDQYVMLLNHNLNQSHKHNFNLQNNINTYGVPYDLGSLMHYGQAYFTINKHNTMVPLDIHRTYEIGQRNGLSFYDLKLATIMYDCAADCTSKPNCRNGGFVDFECKCRCPPGYSGSQCQTEDRKPAPLCGGDFTRPATIKTPNYPNNYPKDINCIWVFKAPADKHVKVSFNFFELIDYEDDNVCHWDHLEVRNADLYEGDKYCDTDLHGKEIISEGNEMALLFHSEYDWNQGLEAEVTFV